MVQAVVVDCSCTSGACADGQRSSSLRDNPAGNISTATLCTRGLLLLCDIYAGYKIHIKSYIQDFAIALITF